MGVESLLLLFHFFEQDDGIYSESTYVEVLTWYQDRAQHIDREILGFPTSSPSQHHQSSSQLENVTQPCRHERGQGSSDWLRLDVSLQTMQEAGVLMTLLVRQGMQCSLPFYGSRQNYAMSYMIMFATRRLSSSSRPDGRRNSLPPRPWSKRVDDCATKFLLKLVKQSSSYGKDTMLTSSWSCSVWSTMHSLVQPGLSYFEPRRSVVRSAFRIRTESEPILPWLCWTATLPA